ncbi:P-loop containing nucleoside triphosphate hydrolase protein [Calocera viscosa TUFC12733]|uniref:p-loop containing nucleoside triphosphate hydrolase protein n=1 Tax=Calocera viscosa (strain TUFC12733) TaxID=1330018 RepID=A0A167GRX2_CALVF|nr:P-loop containing nucleoside triphosphate hydrolase protein [Calocera viscosa TUFC12733]
MGSKAVENKTVIWELDNVVLAKGIKDRIIEDVKTFMGREKWYADRGIPYRRGYLFSGPPGSGKSSFVQALAGTLSMDIRILNLSERGQTDDKLNHLLINAPQQSISLLEDIHTASINRLNFGRCQSAMTFSGLLSTVDSVDAAESWIIFMTTNHPGMLDPVLIRPGQVDLHDTLDDATPAKARMLFERFHAGQRGVKEGGARLKAMLRGWSVTMAALKGLFIISADGTEMALQSLGTVLCPKREPT